MGGEPGGVPARGEKAQVPRRLKPVRNDNDFLAQSSELLVSDV